MGIKHTFLSPKADGPDTNVVRPSDWNSDHTIDGDVDFNGHSILQPKLGGNLDSNGFAILSPLLGGNLNPGTFGSAGNWNPSATATYSLGTPSKQWTDVNLSGQILQNGANVTPRFNLSSTLNFYVATTGSNSTGDGSIGNPYATIDHAFRVVYGNKYDNRGAAVVFHIADGVYTVPPSGFHFYSPYDAVGGGTVFDLGSFDASAIFIVGNTTDSSQVVFDNTGSGAACFNIVNRISLGITGITIRNSARGIVANGPACWVSLGDVHFQDISLFCIQLGYQSQIWCGSASNLRFSGTFGNVGIFAENGGSGFDSNSTTFTFVGTPSFAGAFAEVSNGASVYFSLSTVVGDFTGLPIAVNSAAVQSDFDWTTKGNGRIFTQGTGVYNHTPVSGLGYCRPGTGSSITTGNVTQLTSKTTDVTLNKAAGLITTTADNMGPGDLIQFNLNNNLVENFDLLILNHWGGGSIGRYLFWASCSTGVATIRIQNNHTVALAESLAIQYALIKGGH